MKFIAFSIVVLLVAARTSGKNAAKDRFTAVCTDPKSAIERHDGEQLWNTIKGIDVDSKVADPEEYTKQSLGINRALSEDSDAASDLKALQQRAKSDSALEQVAVPSFYTLAGVTPVAEDCPHREYLLYAVYNTTGWCFIPWYRLQNVRYTRCTQRRCRWSNWWNYGYCVPSSHQLKTFWAWCPNHGFQRIRKYLPQCCVCRGFNCGQCRG